MVKTIEDNNLKSKKQAEVTIEVTLSVALSILVLFLMLGIFSDNLATMAANSGIQNLFNRSNDFAKTKQNTWNTNPTGTVVTPGSQVATQQQSQQNVQIVADQGQMTVKDYVEKALDVINKYSKIPANQLSNAELNDLARYLTIISIAGKSAKSQLPYPMSYYYKNYNIEVLSQGKTSIGENPVFYFDTSTPNDNEIISAIKDVSSQ